MAAAADTAAIPIADVAAQDITEKVRHSHGPIHINTQRVGTRETCLDDTDTESYFSREFHAQDRSPSTSRSPSQDAKRHPLLTL